MSVDIHAWVELIPVDSYLPRDSDPIIVRTEAGRITMAVYNRATDIWTEQHCDQPMTEIITHWAHTYKFNRAIERHAEENEP